MLNRKHNLKSGNSKDKRKELETKKDRKPEKKKRFQKKKIYAKIACQVIRRGNSTIIRTVFSIMLRDGWEGDGGWDGQTNLSWSLLVHVALGTGRVVSSGVAMGDNISDKWTGMILH